MAGAGALVNNGVHPLDLLRFLVGSEVEEVRALTDEKPPKYPVDDMVYVIMEFQNGMHGVVISGILVPRSDNDVVLYGSKAKITCKGTVGVRLQGEFLLESDSLNIRIIYSTSDPIIDLYIRTVEAFNKCIQENTEPEVSGYDGLEMVRIVDAILESSHQDRTIKIVR